MLKDELEAIINSDNGWAAKSTLILAVGILGEYAVLPFFENAKVSLVGSLLKSRRPTELRDIVDWWQKKLKIVFAIMVLGGVIGEYEFSSRIARNADRLQQISDQELGDAIDTASAAVERAEVLRKDNLILQANVLKLQEAASWRVFSTAQHDKFVSLAKQRFRAAPAFTVEVDSVVGNPEAKSYGAKLALAISDGLGLKVAPPEGLSTCLECVGVWVCVYERRATPAASDGRSAIRELLELSGVKATKLCNRTRDEQGAETTVRITVGPKE